ncbi:MAG TPA: HD domain-containing protein [Candidatus Acidoferrales bacterium]|nr:HD domain-containing protein [Candidatus Acidoferrales bacterium]
MFGSVMLFRDDLHGVIDFRGTPYQDLLYELLGCPEVQRLRHMRLMNFDAPHIQDLASARRFPHSIGVSFLAYKLAERSSLTIGERKTLITAGLLHDVGILPFGHLLETIIKKKNPTFSHEKLVESILFGNYHPTNKYHQILVSSSLQLAGTLRRHGIKSDEVFRLICPPGGSRSAVSADIDIDNIDNVHRMAYLLGYEGVHENLELILKNIVVDSQMKLRFSSDAIPAIRKWLVMREQIYTMIITHPECVSYNAFLKFLLINAVESNVIDEKTWFLTDSQFEQNLLDNSSTRSQATWLLSRPQYELIDYVWFVSTEKPPVSFPLIEEGVSQSDIMEFRLKAQYFFWPESKLVARETHFQNMQGAQLTVGTDSSSILVSAIATRDYGRDMLGIPEKEKNAWRVKVIELVKTIAPGWRFWTKFPEDYDERPLLNYFERRQIELF